MKMYGENNAQIHPRIQDVRVRILTWVTILLIIFYMEIFRLSNQVSDSASS
jgi:hypothetical protein